MLEKYEYIIYHSEEEKAEIQKSFDEGYNQVWNEGKCLFDLASEKYGKSLWSGLAWKDEDCKSKCPFGDGCEDDMIIIDDKALCMGQIYYYNYSLNDIIDMIRQSKTSYLTVRGSVKKCILGCKKISEQCCKTFPDIENELCCQCSANSLPFILDEKLHGYFNFFGEEFKSSDKVYGDIVISLLEQDCKDAGRHPFPPKPELQGSMTDEEFEMFLRSCEGDNLLI